MSLFRKLIVHILPALMLFVGVSLPGTRANVATDVMSSSTSTGTDAATDWNAIAVQSLLAAGPARPGQIVFLDLAIVQVAVHDAVQAIDRRFEPYHVKIKGASGSPEAAAAKAAHDVLVNILPAQAASLDMTYHNYLTDHDLAEDDPGVQVGELAAAGILALRANDGRVPNPLPAPFIGGTDIGVWRPTPSFLAAPPPSFAPMALPWLGSVPPFTLKSGDQFRSDAPTPLSSKQYAKDYNEVKALGARFNSTRTPSQNQLASFYSGNLFIVYTQTLRDVAAAQTDNIGDNARLLALGTLAMADSLITAWGGKIQYVFWRPITAIREGDNDGNPRTAGDPTWEPLINTPNYPEYPSGANIVVGALTRLLELYFGTDKVTFTVISANPLADPNTRMYHSFSDLSWDTVDVRIYQGIHFRFADEEARTEGRNVAEWAFQRFLRPID